MGTIVFSHNWNNKLGCDCFTTIRLHNPQKYKVKQVYHILLNDNLIKEAIILDIKTISFSQINNFIAYLDTGLSVEECKGLLKRMYYKIKDIENQKFDFILLKTIRKIDLFS